MRCFGGTEESFATSLDAFKSGNKRERMVEYIEGIDREDTSGNFRHLLVLRELAEWTL